MCDIAKFKIFRKIPRNLVISATNRENQGLPRQTTIFCIFRDIIGNFGETIDQRSSGPMGINPINRYKLGSVVTNGDQWLQMGINGYKSEVQSL